MQKSEKTEKKWFVNTIGGGSLQRPIMDNSRLRTTADYAQRPAVQRPQDNCVRVNKEVALGFRRSYVFVSRGWSSLLEAHETNLLNLIKFFL